MCSWQPQQQGLRELVVLLRDAANPNSRDHGLVNQVQTSSAVTRNQKTKTPPFFLAAIHF